MGVGFRRARSDAGRHSLIGFLLAVESEATVLAFDFAVIGFVPIILGASRHEFHDVIVGIQFSGELSEVISQREGWVGPVPPGK